MSRHRASRGIEPNGFVHGGERNYLDMLNEEYQTRTRGLLLRLQTADDEPEKARLDSAIEELRSDYEAKVSAAKWNLY